MGSSQDITEIIERITRWVSDSFDCLLAADPHVPEVLNDRAADNWRTLLAIADCAGGEWPQRARDAAIALSSNNEENDETDAALLLQDIRWSFRQLGKDRLRSTDLTASLSEMEPAVGRSGGMEGR